MLNRLRPALLALNTLSLWLNDQAEHVLNALQAAPNLTVLTFYIILCDDDDHKNRKTFCDILDKAFPWDAFATKPTSMRSVLLHKFPLIRRVGFYFCALRRSTLHFRRGLRRKMERQLKDRLEKTSADLGEYLDVGWLDEQYHPVVYSQKNGKPQWGFRPDSPRQEPETEASGWEDSESDAESVQNLYPYSD
jgi:hypothetical protein